MTRNTKDCPKPSPSFKKAIEKIIQKEMLEIYNLLKKYYGNLGLLIRVVNETLIHDVIYRSSKLHYVEKTCKRWY